MRHDYDAPPVFVHMNPEYIMLGDFSGNCGTSASRSWYTHKINLKLRIAVFFADIVFTASVESFRLPTKKLRDGTRHRHGLLFSPIQDISREIGYSPLVGLCLAKRHDLAIRMAAQEDKELHIAGEGSENENLEALANELGARVQFLGPLTQRQLRDEYRRAGLLIHTSETGSLDKVVLEALACGLHVRTNDLRSNRFENATPDFIRKHHSLARLVPRIFAGVFGRLPNPDPKKFYDDEMGGQARRRL